MIHIVVLAALCVPIGLLPADDQQAAIERVVERAEAPSALYAMGAGIDRPIAVVAGMADPAMGRLMSVDTPLRIASNTKTFVAATVLRLHEQGRIDLDAAIGPLLDPELVAILKADGYAPERITVRQLMEHSAGLYDHGGDPRYIAAVIGDPRREWKRRDLVRLMAEYADPQSEPGTRFLYSDTGYVLLGDIVERLTRRPLATAVREELRFDALGLQATWWEIMEAPPVAARPRARQYIDGRDATSVHASFDLYGGGGLLMSVRDLATVFAALFEGRIFDDPRTLETMVAMGGHEGAERYRLGLLVRHEEGREIYWHSGFWGTAVYYDPARRRTVAAFTTRQEAFRRELAPLALSMLGLVPDTGQCKAPASSG